MVIDGTLKDVRVFSRSVQGWYGEAGKGSEAEGFRQRFPQDGASAVGADGEIDTRQFEQKLLPVQGLIFCWGVGMGRGQEGQEELSGDFEFALRMSRCHEPKVTDTDKPVGQDMEQETADELLCGQADKPVGTRVLVVPGTEGNGLPIEGHESLVGDGGAVGVMAQVAEDMLGTIERGLRVGIPFDSSQVADESFEGRRVLEARREPKIALTPGLLEAVEEFATQ